MGTLAHYRNSYQLVINKVEMVLTARIRYEEGSYEGEINDNKNPEGQGVFEYRGDDDDGRLMYEGGWVNKKAEGFGVMRWQNGDRYEGDWKDGFRHGHGVYQCKATGGKYTGNYENDLKSGDGTYKYSNGDSFEGQWSEGLRHGHGVYKWMDKNENDELETSPMKSPIGSDVKLMVPYCITWLLVVVFLTLASGGQYVPHEDSLALEAVVA